MKEESRKEVKETLRSSLQGMLGDDLPVENGEILDRPDSDEGDMMYIEPYDKNSQESKAKKKAKKVIISMLRLFMNDGLIVKSEFIRAKANMDIMSIEKILLSLSQIEYAVDVIMRDISFGQSSPRMLEVFGQLQKTKVELIREYNNMMLNFEESVKRYKLDMEYMDDSGSVRKVKVGGRNEENIVRGNRNLMKQIQGEINEAKESEENVEDADYEEE